MIRVVESLDNTPFCTMLFIDTAYRDQGYGKRMMEYWEQARKRHRGRYSPVCNNDHHSLHP